MQYNLCNTISFGPQQSYRISAMFFFPLYTTLARLWMLYKPALRACINAQHEFDYILTANERGRAGTPVGTEQRQPNEHQSRRAPYRHRATFVPSFSHALEIRFRLGWAGRGRVRTLGVALRGLEPNRTSSSAPSHGVARCHGVAVHVVSVYVDVFVPRCVVPSTIWCRRIMCTFRGHIHAFA